MPLSVSQTLCRAWCLLVPSNQESAHQPFLHRHLAAPKTTTQAQEDQAIPKGEASGLDVKRHQLALLQNSASNA